MLVFISSIPEELEPHQAAAIDVVRELDPIALRRATSKPDGDRQHHLARPLFGDDGEQEQPGRLCYDL